MRRQRAKVKVKLRSKTQAMKGQSDTGHRKKMVVPNKEIKFKYGANDKVKLKS